MTKIISNKNTVDETSKKLKNFTEVLEKIKHADDKKKILWKEIYENALVDRQNAHILFVEAYSAMTNTAAEHLSLGGTLSKYLERMNKSNEQLLKLADLVSKSESEFNAINTDDIFNQIDDS